MIRPLLLAMVTAACTPTGTPVPREVPIGLANPASVYCAKQGGHFETRDTPEGQVGHCHLPDGRVIEEWELLQLQDG